MNASWSGCSLATPLHISAADLILSININVVISINRLDKRDDILQNAG